MSPATVKTRNSLNWNYTFFQSSISKKDKEGHITTMNKDGHITTMDKEGHIYNNYGYCRQHEIYDDEHSMTVFYNESL